jgi:toxin ParE1/3/4
VDPTRRLIWAQPALDELDEIAAHIALDKPDAAAQLVSRCLDVVERLVHQPASGRWVPELQERRYREVIVPPCRILYRREGEDVLIVHVLRGERRLRRSRLR